MHITDTSALVAAALVAACTGGGAAFDADAHSDADAGPPELTSCPSSRFGAEGRTCAGFDRCEWGRQCCCGECAPMEGCACTSGRMECYSDDLCLWSHESCSPGCDWQEVMTPDGCQTCAPARADLDRDLDALAASFAACAVDDDCVIQPAVDCASTCAVAIAASQVDAFASAAATFAASGDRCHELTIVCDAGHTRCPSVARCVEQRCVALDACAAEVAAVGDLCDDGDACTVESRCDASRHCVGVGLPCDDGDPCSRDMCSAEKVCEHMPRVGDCASPTDGCSLGGTCRDGACRATQPGFTAAVSGRRIVLGAVVDRGDDPILVVGRDDVGGSERATLWPFDATGAAAEPIAISSTERADDALLLPDGDLLVAGGRFETSKVDLVLARVSPQGVARWSRLVPGPGYDVAAMLALGGDGHFATAWQRGEAGEGHVMLAVGDPDGSPPVIRELHVTGLGWDRWPFERAAVAATDAGFVVLAADERGTLVLTPVDSDDGVGAPLELPFDDGRRPRGVLALAGGDLVLWGPRGLDQPGWMRRITASGALVWDRSGDVDVALVRTDELVVAAHDGQGPFVARHDLANGDELERFDLPSTPGPTHAAALVPAGLLLVGNDDGAAWLRRVTLWSACRDASCVPEGCVPPDDDTR